VKEDKVLSLEGPAEVEAKSPLEQLLAQGARKMLQAAIEHEVEGIRLTNYTVDVP
jgi:hypothetical protein